MPIGIHMPIVHGRCIFWQEFSGIEKKLKKELQLKRKLKSGESREKVSERSLPMQGAMFPVRWRWRDLPLPSRRLFLRLGLAPPPSCDLNVRYSRATHSQYTHCQSDGVLRRPSR
jgi:hypothetical protein